MGRVSCVFHGRRARGGGIQCLPLDDNHRHLSGPARAVGEEARHRSHSFRLCRSAAQFGHLVVGRHSGQLGRVSQADPGGPQLLDERHSVLEHRYRRVLRRESQRPEIPGAVHALVPVRRLHAHVPRARHRRRQGVLAIRPAHTEDHREVRTAALPPDAVYLFGLVAGDEPGQFDAAPAGDGLRRRPDRAHHRRPVSVRPIADGESSDRGGSLLALRLSSRQSRLV